MLFFRLYIMRSRRISNYQRRANLNFLKLARRAYKLKEQADLLPKKQYDEKRATLIRDLQRQATDRKLRVVDGSKQRSNNNLSIWR